MQYLSNTYWLFLLLTCVGCSVNQQDIAGTYTIKGLKNNIDTLMISNSGTYKRTLHAQVDQRLLFQNSGEWKYLEGRVELSDYLLDEDENHGKQEVLGLGAMTCFLPIEKKLTKTVIYYRNGGDDTFYYEKL